MNDVEHTTPHTDEDNTLPVFSQLGVALGILVLIFGVSYIPTLSAQLSEAEPTPLEKQVINTVPIHNEEKLSETIDYFEDVRLIADAAYVWDVKNQKALFNQNAGEQLPLASLTKLMTSLVASENLHENHEIAITEKAINQDGVSGLRVGTIFTFKALNDLTLMTSSNDGAYALAHAAGTVLNQNTKNPTDTFIKTMNKRAAEIGLSQTYFINATGLDESITDSGGYGTARDVAFLMEYILVHNPEILERTVDEGRIIKDNSGATHKAANTNVFTDEIPGLIGSKTGYTDLAGGNLVIAFDAGLNHPIVVSVLGSTRSGRFEDVLDLVERSRKTIIHR